MDRRTILAMTGALVSGAAKAQNAPGSQPGDPNEFIALWSARRRAAPLST